MVLCLCMASEDTTEQKKKRYTINIVIANKDNIILHLTDCYFGNKHDFVIIKSEHHVKKVTT